MCAPNKSTTAELLVPRIVPRSHQHRKRKNRGHVRGPWPYGRDVQPALSIFFVSFALCEPITNALLKRFNPSVFITFSMILWGICLTSMGLIENFAGLAVARFFLVNLESTQSVPDEDL